MTIGEICTRDVVIVNRNESVRDAAKLMRQYHVGDVVVVDEVGGTNVPVGILTDRDIVIEIVAAEADAGIITAGDAMSLELVTIPEHEGIWETLEVMRAKGIRRVPVTGPEGRLTGVVTIDDLLELLSEELNEMVGIIRHGQKRERKAHP